VKGYKGHSRSSKKAHSIGNIMSLSILVVCSNNVSGTVSDIFTSLPVGMRSFAISVSVCLSVCLSVCISPRVSQKLRVQISRNFLCTRYPWSRLSPPLMTLQLQQVMYRYFYYRPTCHPSRRKMHSSAAGAVKALRVVRGRHNRRIRW